jgi:hypothetical protein
MVQGGAGVSIQQTRRWGSLSWLPTLTKDKPAGSDSIGHGSNLPAGYVFGPCERFKLHTSSLVRMKMTPRLSILTDEKLSVEPFRSFIDKPYYVDRLKYKE